MFFEKVELFQKYMGVYLGQLCRTEGEVDRTEKNKRKVVVKLEEWLSTHPLQKVDKCRVI